PALGALIVLWLGGKAVVDGPITLGSFVAFNGYLAQLAWPTIALGWTLASIQRGLAAMQRVIEILDAGPEPLIADRDGPESREARLGEGPIEFKDLTFAYDERGPVLSDVSFAVPAGAVVAIVGPTGSGKSTLGALLCRLYEPPRGSVFVGGRDVHDLPAGRLRRSIGYVPHEAVPFSPPPPPARQRPSRRRARRRPAPRGGGAHRRAHRRSGRTAGRLGDGGRRARP